MMTACCAVFDTAIQAFGQPFFVPAVGAALRSFTDEVNRDAKDNQLFMHSDDFELWHLSFLDQETGEFHLPDDGHKRMIARGKDVKNG